VFPSSKYLGSIFLPEYFYPETGSTMFLRNIGNHLPDNGVIKMIISIFIISDNHDLFQEKPLVTKVLADNDDNRSRIKSVTVPATEAAIA
jgi:hypothetical protein